MDRCHNTNVIRDKDKVILNRERSERKWESKPLRHQGLEIARGVRSKLLLRQGGLVPQQLRGCRVCE